MPGLPPGTGGDASGGTDAATLARIAALEGAMPEFRVAVYATARDPVAADFDAPDRRARQKTWTVRSVIAIAWRPADGKANLQLNGAVWSDTNIKRSTAPLVDDGESWDWLRLSTDPTDRRLRASTRQVGAFFYDD